MLLFTHPVCIRHSAGPGHPESPQRLATWSRELERVARHAEHPWSEALLIEALVRCGAEALAPRAQSGRAPARGLDTLVE